MVFMLQKIICYVNADGPVGKVTDSSGQTITGAANPVIVRGIDALLCVRLLREGKAYPASELAFETWGCYFCDDWNDATPPLMVADNDNIVLVEEAEYTELQIPLLASNTSAIIERITGNSEITLGLELCAYIAGDAKAKFALQFNLDIRNRRNMNGEIPAEQADLYYNADQIDALLKAGY
jgi:hypothetical protein